MYPGTTATHSPDKPAVIVHGTGLTISYGELERRANQLANAWRSAGLAPGDHVALLTTNDARAFEIYWAAMRSGLYITAVNRHLNADEVGYIVHDCEAKALVVSAKLAELAEAVTPLTPRVELRLALDGPTASYHSYEDFIAHASSSLPADRPRGADMLYSSGTTGQPKGVMTQLPNAQIEDHAEPIIHLAQRGWGVGPDTVYLSPAPIYHAAPLRIASAVLALGGTVILMERFDAESALQAIEEHKVTHSQWVPTMFVRMLKLPSAVREKYRHDTMTVALHAAAPCPVEVKEAMIAWWGPVLVEYYSSTEGNGLTMINTAEWQSHRGSVGKAIVGVIHICDDLGAELPAQGIGTVYFERDELPFEYHGDSAKTAQAQHPAHSTWTTTGDLGYLDDDGYLYLTDRKAFLIISGGVNIYPQEIENALILHPSVEDVAVVGIPDAEMGESVCAFVVAPGHESNPHLADELTQYARERVSSYKVPREIRFVPSVPRTPTGKLVKGQLRQQMSALEPRKSTP